MLFLCRVLVKLDMYLGYSVVGVFKGEFDKIFIFYVPLLRLVIGGDMTLATIIVAVWAVTGFLIVFEVFWTSLKLLCIMSLIGVN